MSYAKINYGGTYDIAELWGDFEEEGCERFFMEHANQCFGIRKSIMGFSLQKFDADGAMPEPWSKFPDAATMLKHSGGDTIVWDSKGKKIKSEFD